jgi:hypothetical protein
LQALAESLNAVLKEQENLRAVQEQDRAKNRKFQQDSARNYQDLAKAMLDEQRLNREERTENRAMWQNYLLKTETTPVVAIQPVSTSQQLLIGNNVSASNDNAVSVSQAGPLEASPLPRGLSESNPPPPARDGLAGQIPSPHLEVDSSSKRAEVSMEARAIEEEQSLIGHSLSVDPQ